MRFCKSTSNKIIIKIFFFILLTNFEKLIMKTREKYCKYIFSSQYVKKMSFMYLKKWKFFTSSKAALFFVSVVSMVFFKYRCFLCPLYIFLVYDFFHSKRWENINQIFAKNVFYIFYFDIFIFYFRNGRKWIYN